MKRNTLNNSRKFSYLLSSLSVTVASMSLIKAATLVFVGQDNQFNNTTTVTGSPFLVASTSGLGTSSYTINYTYEVNLTSIGGSATESVSFSVNFTSTDGVIPNQSTIGVDGTADATNNIDSGESVTATISFTPSGYFTGVEFGAIQSYGPGDMEVGGTTNTAVNPVFQINDPSFTIKNVDPGTDGGNIGFAQYRMIVDTDAVPEPSSTALLGLGGLALILRRRK